MTFLHESMFGSPEQERERFRKTAEQWIAAGKPVRLHLGFGQHPLRDFLNLDMRLCVREGREPADFHENCFIFDWPAGLPLADNVADFVFHEDMFEHLSQKQQYRLLAEVLRVLAPGRFHRINCPNIAYIMRTESDFSRGAAGVVDEWERWSHVNVPTPASLEEQAKIVGYDRVHFNGKNQTVSGVWFRERRPGGQYDQFDYNIFADLQKGAATAAAAASDRKRAAFAPMDITSEADWKSHGRALRMVDLVDAGDRAAARAIYDAEQDHILRSSSNSVQVAAMRLALAAGDRALAVRHALRVNARDRYLALHRPEWVFEVAGVLDGSPEHAGEGAALRDGLHEVGERFPRIYPRLLNKLAAPGDDEASQAVISWLLEKPIDHPPLADRLAQRMQASGRTAEAIAICNRQLAFTADDDQILNRLARLLMAEARLEDAVPVLERLAARETGDDWTSLTLASVLQKLGRREDALAAVDRLTSRTPDNGHALVMKARLEWMLGRRQDAGATARKALENSVDAAARTALESLLSKVEAQA